LVRERAQIVPGDEQGIILNLRGNGEERKPF
jgi:hypothetical protein